MLNYLSAKYFVAALFAVIALQPDPTRADARFLIPDSGQAESRVSIMTDGLARQFGAIFIDQTEGEITAYFASYFFENEVSCAPVSSLATIDGGIVRWVPKTSVAEIHGEYRLKIENTEDMIEELFDAERLEVLLTNKCGGKTLYSFDLKGYERAMKKMGIE